MTLPYVAWGWIAEACAWAFFGSFAVPMRSSEVMKVRIDALVYQSWKTAVFFITSWLVLTFKPFVFTPWGLLSGLLWIPGGVLFIIAVQNAGLAVGQGVAQSCMVAWSFFWSMFVFHEPMWSLWLTALAMLVLIGGVVGMTFVMRPVISPPLQQQQQQQQEGTSDHRHHYQEKPLLDESASGSVQEDDQRDIETSSTVVYLGSCCRVSRRSFGIVCALFSGFFGGTGLVPLKLAQTISGFSGGIDFVLSFAIGALCVQTCFWLVYLGVRTINGTRPIMPPVHFRIMLVPGLISGCLWSAGNVCQIYAVLLLGVGVGSGCVQVGVFAIFSLLFFKPLYQANLLVAGIWGILYYREIVGLRILLWICFALIALGGILGLSFLQYFGVAAAAGHNSTAF